LLAEPATLIICAAVAAFSLSAYYYLHRDEDYQDPILVGAVGAGFLVGVLAGLEPSEALLGVVPACGIVALLLSTYRPWMS